MRPATHARRCSLTALRATLVAGGATLALLATAPAALAEPPAVLGESSSNVTPFAARMEAIVNPNEVSTTCKFEYGTTNAYGTSVPCEAETIEGGEQGVGANLTGLRPGTTYHFRVVLENSSSETTEGADAEVTTLAAEAPIVTGETATNSGEPQLEARIIPNYQETEYQFEYATSEAKLLAGEGVVVKGAAPLPAVYEALQAGPVTLHGLAGGQYFSRVAATNATGTTDGGAQPFDVFAAPLASTGGASGMTRTTAVVTGSATPQGLPTTYQILYVPDAAYQAGAPNPYAAGRATPAGVLDEAPSEPDYAAHPVQALLEELQPNTTYHYTVFASNELGSTRGSDATFTTGPPTPPFASTGGTEGVSQLSATLTGSADTSGLTTTVQFELGTTPGAGTLLAATITSTSETTETLAATVSGALAPNTTYYYRLIATNQDGTSYGAERSFTTGGFPAPFNVPTTNVPLLHYTTIAELDAKEAKEHNGGGGNHHGSSHKRKLAKALKACHRDKRKSRRAACERQAKHRYGK